MKIEVWSASRMKTHTHTQGHVPSDETRLGGSNRRFKDLVHDTLQVSLTGPSGDHADTFSRLGFSRGLFIWLNVENACG